MVWQMLLAPDYTSFFGPLTTLIMPDQTQLQIQFCILKKSYRNCPALRVNYWSCFCQSRDMRQGTNGTQILRQIERS